MTTSRNLSYHPRSLKRNQELHDLLVFISNCPAQASLAGIAEKFRWLPHTVQANLTILRRDDLIQTANGLGGERALYKRGSYTQAELEALLPTKPPEGYVYPKSATTLKDKAAERSAIPVHRDPMTAMLMGGSRASAPSLNFTDSRNGA